MVANKIFEIGLIQRVIADSGIIKHFIPNCKLICNYYDNYLEYQTGSRNVLRSYEKITVFLPLDNRFLNLANVWWYAPDLAFNLISTIVFGEGEVEMGLETIDDPSQILHDGELLWYWDHIDGRYIFWIKKTSELPIIANITSPQPKKSIEPHDIKLWHSPMEHLGYKTHTIFKSLRSGIEFHGLISAKLCWDHQKGD